MSRDHRYPMSARLGKVFIFPRRELKERRGSSGGSMKSRKCNLKANAMVVQDLEVVVEGTTCTISEGDLTNGDLEM
jgi:hypothetical protein